MTRKRLQKIRRRLGALRRRPGQIKPIELIRIARSLEREPSRHGKEPNYVNDRPGWPPVSIPNHPGTLKIGTALNILNALEEDIERFEEELSKESSNGEDRS